MEAREFKPYFIVIGLLILTSLALAYTVDVNITNEAGIEVALPAEVGEWIGKEIRYCLNPEHAAEYFAEDLTDPNVCPECQHELYGMSIDERNVLPSDTIILKKRYQHPTGQIVVASIVLSGVDRSSIHRPQLCLTGQGQEIVESWVLPVHMEGRRTLKVMVLDLLRRGRGMEGRQIEMPGYYAYWFVGKGRETHSHLMRMFWMASDRVFRNVAHRWAYISVSGLRDQDGPIYKAQIEEFIQVIYPYMAIN